MRSVSLLAAGIMVAGVGVTLAGEAPEAKSAPKMVAVNPQIAALGDGGAVQLKTNEPTPLGRGYCARMPYDPVNKVALYYGACHNPHEIAQNDVWMFEAATATWTELVKTDPRNPELKHGETGVQVPKDGPPRPPGVGHTYNVICFDESLGRMVSLRGGTPPWLGGWPKKEDVEKMQAAAQADGTDLARAKLSLPWLFDIRTRTWKLAAPDGGDTPKHTRAEACCYDPKHKRVLYWSTDGDVANRKDGVYAYDGAANRWTFSPTKGSPAPGIEQLACWDSVNERVLYFSGSFTGTTRQAKAFDYATLTWTDLQAKGWPELDTAHPRNGPLAQFCSGGGTLAFDSLNGVALVFRQDSGKVLVHPYDVRSNTFGKAQGLFAFGGGQLNSYYDPDQNAAIAVAGGDLGKTQTWAYRYRKEQKKP